MRCLGALWLVLLLRYAKSVENENGFVLVAKQGDRSQDYACLKTIDPAANLSIDPFRPWNLPSNDPSRSTILIKNTGIDPALEWKPGTLVLAPDDTRFKERLIQLSHQHPLVVFGQLKRSDFDRLSTMSESARVTLYLEPEQISYFAGHSAQVFLFVYCCAFGSILLGSIMICLTREEILLRFQELVEQSKRSKWACFLSMGFLLVLLVGTLMIYYFFYDIAVYAGIGLFCVLGVLAVTDVVSFWIMYCCTWARTTIPLNFRLCGRHINSALHVTKLCVFPFAVALISTWLVYRKDPNIGWPMQSIIGVIMVSWILKNSGLSFLSLKMITIFFTFITLYDIFFVFITPLMHRSSPAPSIPVVGDAPLVRQARSVDPQPQQSVMEAVATGSAGRSGELLPISFRFQLAFKSGLHGCATSVYQSLLGYGDAVIPGMLAGYLIFFDSFWEIRFRRNFLTSLVGYILGMVVTHLALNLMQIAQPALLYLCPCTLGLVVASCALFGGRDELRRLWTGSLPPPGLSSPQSREPTEPNDKQPGDLMVHVTNLDGDASPSSGTLASLVSHA